MTLLVVLFLELAGSGEAAQKSAAQEHFQRGQKLYAAGKYTDALGEFKAGYKSYPLPGFLINIGQAYRKMGQRGKAITAYQQYLDLQPPRDPMRKQVEDVLHKLQDEERAEQIAFREQVRALPAADLTAKPPPEPAPAAAVLSAPPPPPPREPGPSWYGRWWVWALVGAVAAGGAVAAVSLSGGGSAAIPPGSLGLIDGRR